MSIYGPNIYLDKPYNILESFDEEYSNFNKIIESLDESNIQVLDESNVLEKIKSTLDKFINWLKETWKKILNFFKSKFNILKEKISKKTKEKQEEYKRKTEGIDVFKQMSNKFWKDNDVDIDIFPNVDEFLKSTNTKDFNAVMVPYDSFVKYLKSGDGGYKFFKGYLGDTYSDDDSKAGDVFYAKVDERYEQCKSSMDTYKKDIDDGFKTETVKLKDYINNDSYFGEFPTDKMNKIKNIERYVDNANAAVEQSIKDLELIEDNLKNAQVSIFNRGRLYSSRIKTVSKYIGLSKELSTIFVNLISKLESYINRYSVTFNIKFSYGIKYTEFMKKYNESDNKE